MTLIMAFCAAYFLSQSPYFICPRVNLLTQETECVPQYVFVQREYDFPPRIIELLDYIGIHHFHSAWLFPFQLHAIVLGFFCSIIAPFGGFFASGFKRAFKIKDFADTIPGHGGITDRMDCQVVMAVFVFVYFNNFVYSASDSIAVVLNSIRHLDPNHQIEIYQALGKMLQARGLLQA